MDMRRLSTSDILASGILSQSTPNYGIPEGRERTSLYTDWEPGVSEAAARLDAGEVIDCPEYYGIPTCWKADNGYHAILLQYRNISENHVFSTVEECAEWFTDTAWKVSG